MNMTEVLSLLEANKNDRGIENWKKLGASAGELKSFGIGLTQLRKLAKRIGRDRDLATDLWKGDVYDGKVIALLIDDPEAMTQEQAEAQVEELGAGLLSHVFSSCDATLAKTPFVVDLASKWIDSKDPFGSTVTLSPWTSSSTSRTIGSGRSSASSSQPRWNNH